MHSFEKLLKPVAYPDSEILKFRNFGLGSLTASVGG